MGDSQVSLQREYYQRTADQYDNMHMDGDAEHQMALAWLGALISKENHKSLLDIGSGTGRALHFLKNHGLEKTVGIEPVAELRAVGHAGGLASDQLVDGDATALAYPDNSFDIVSEFATLHHIKDHKAAVREMCRVAKHGVFISDSNNFGQGSKLKRRIKRLINGLGLWSVYDWLATKGKGFHWSEGDGLFYSYTVFRDVPVIQEKFPQIHFLTTQPAKGFNLFGDAPHLAIYATKSTNESS